MSSFLAVGGRPQFFAAWASPEHGSQHDSVPLATTDEPWHRAGEGYSRCSTGGRGSLGATRGLPTPSLFSAVYTLPFK